jgi:hypothetical protein
MARRACVCARLWFGRLVCLAMDAPGVGTSLPRAQAENCRLCQDAVEDKFPPGCEILQSVRLSPWTRGAPGRRAGSR